MERAKPPPIQVVLRRLAQLVLDEARAPSARARIVGSISIAFGGKIAIVCAPFAIGAFVDALAEGRTGAPLFLPGLVALWLALRIAAQAAPWLSDDLFMPVSERIRRRAGVGVFSHMLSLPSRVHLTRGGGNLYFVIDRGMRALDFLLRYLTLIIAPALAEFVFAMVVLGWRYGAGLGAAATGVVVIYVALTIALVRVHLQHRSQASERAAEVARVAFDSLANFEAAKSFSSEAREVGRYETAVVASARAAIDANASIVRLNIVQELVMSGGLAALVVLAGAGVASGAMSVGDIVIIVLLMLNLYAPMSILAYSYREIRETAMDMERMFGVLETPTDADAPGARDLLAPHGELACEAVAFAHAGRRQALKSVSFVARAGEITAIVGRSGVGKSALLKLLCRFEEPKSGRILIDGEDVANVTRESFRSVVALVPQEVVLFNDTIRYNIAFGAPDATQAEIERAAAQAQLLSFIETLPQRWDTLVGERGTQLSGGQKQRVGIARALLTNPKIIILDEATAWLDAASEAEVHAAIVEASKARTTIIVAHRFSAIAAADQIVVLEDGVVAETGTHGALMARGGAYARLRPGRSGLGGRG